MTQNRTITWENSANSVKKMVAWKKDVFYIRKLEENWKLQKQELMRSKKTTINTRTTPHHKKHKVDSSDAPRKSKSNMETNNLIKNWVGAPFYYPHLVSTKSIELDYLSFSFWQLINNLWYCFMTRKRGNTTKKKGRMEKQVQQLKHHHFHCDKSDDV